MTDVQSDGTVDTTSDGLVADSGEGHGGSVPPDDPVRLAREMLAGLRRSEDVSTLRERLAELDPDALSVLQADSDAAIAFWANCYNAGTQFLLQDAPERYDSSLRMRRFFAAPAVTVAGTPLSLDAIEHGILRGGRSKYGLGYLPRLPRAAERRFRLAEPDPRIHFALNCGAASCPAIRVYEGDRMAEQLDAATAAYLEGHVAVDADAGAVDLPRLFLWYRGDFGGRSGIRSLLTEYGIVDAPENARRFSYRPWDWSKAPAKFRD